jgi:SNF2 family DNA or RNA helicase
MSGLWRHQQEALAFVEQLWGNGRHGAMLAMDMGTGKSRVAVEAARRRRLSPILILCPLRVVDPWREQFERFGGEYEFLALDDRIDSVARKMEAARERLRWTEARGRALAIAVNYESARLKPFGRWAANRPWPLVIADEIHKTKSASGAISRFVGRLGLMARYRLGLTGTPMPHSPLDVWAQYRFLDRRIYDDTYCSFQARYAEMGGFHKLQVKSYQHLDELREKFFSIAFQVGAEVLDLPGVQDLTLHAALGAKAARAYGEMERDLITRIEDGTVTAQNALVRLMRLAQITQGFATTEEDPEHPVMIDEGKRLLLEDLLEDLPPEEPVVIFALFKADLNAIVKTGAALGRRVGVLRGGHSDLAAWQRGGPEDPVILAVQIQAGGVGISLTRARYGVYYSIGFNLADYVQSRARLVRAGQTRPVIFYHLVMRDTIDEIVRGALDRRQDLIDSVLQELPCHQTMLTTTR